MKRTGLWLVLCIGLVTILAGCVPNPPLDACFTILADPVGDPTTRLFNAACTTDYEEPLYPTEIYTFRWSFGDGHMRIVHGNVLTTYKYLESGTYTVELLVIDPEDGRTARATRKVTIGSP